ncbi:MAG: hypothetical protein K0R90_333 [Oscillospiraceae bacterium]|jgi:hypothetical protein|nr:hypothetical protein [Oscillospiraceae bacterium]
MQELSLNILDIVQNSIKANATVVHLSVKKITSECALKIEIKDNGCGMSEEQVEQVMNPFFTTRTTRKVGLGVPFFKMTAEMTGGSFFLDSVVGKGTTVKACYKTDHIDMLPMGDIAATMMSLISVNPDIDFVFNSKVDNQEFCLDTREIKKELEDVPINSGEVLLFIKDFIDENQSNIEIII